MGLGRGSDIVPVARHGMLGIAFTREQCSPKKATIVPIEYTHGLYTQGRFDQIPYIYTQILCQLLLLDNRMVLAKGKRSVCCGYVCRQMPTPIDTISDIETVSV